MKCITPCQVLSFSSFGIINFNLSNFVRHKKVNPYLKAELQLRVEVVGRKETHICLPMTEMENPAVLDLLKRLEEDNETKANNNNNNNRENVPSLLSDDCAGGYVATAVAATAAAASNVTAERNPDGDLNKATTISKSKKRHVSNTNTDPKIKKQKKKEVKKKTRSSNAFTGKNKTNGKLKNPPSANESGVSIVKKTDVLAATEIITNPTSVSTTAVANAKPVPNKQSSPSDVIQLTVVNPGLKDIDRGQQCNDVAYSGIVTDKNAVMMKDDSLDRDTTKVNTASNSNSTFSLKAASEPETLVDKPKKGAQSNKTITEKMVSKNTKVAYKPEKTVWDNTDSPEATTKPVTNKNLGTNVAIQKISSCEEFSLSTDNHAAPRWLQDRVDQIKNETKSVLDSRKLFLEMTIHDQATQDMKEDIPTLVLWGAPKAGKVRWLAPFLLLLLLLLLLFAGVCLSVRVCSDADLIYLNFLVFFFLHCVCSLMMIVAYCCIISLYCSDFHVCTDYHGTLFSRYDVSRR